MSRDNLYENVSMAEAVAVFVQEARDDQKEMLETITMLKSENYAYKAVRTKAQHSIEENENQIKNLLQKIKEENDEQI